MTYRDITADLAREEELIRARFVAEESSRHRSEFVARMSHEMRTPLNGILGVTALLQRQELGERTTELLGVIRASGTVLLRLIDDILDLSKLEAETFEMVSDDFDLTDVVEECIALIEPGAEEKGLDVHVLWPRSRIPKLFGDMVRIKQILLNLLTNAVKFTDQGQIVVTLDGAWAPDGVAVTLAVSDTGFGIAEDRLEQIFAEFYQIDGTATRKYGGAGLGLSITKKLLNLIGGKIEVESEPGVGSTFRVGLTLPKAGRISQAS